MTKIISTLAMLFLFSACQTVVDFPVPFEKKMVIHGFIRPSNAVFSADSVLISVGTNSTLTGANSYTEVTNATVKLKSNQQEVMLPLLPRSWTDLQNRTRRYGIASNNFPIFSNQTYSLSVTTPDGLEAKASCLVPAKTVEENKVKIMILEKGKNAIRCKVDWEDIPNEANFYSISVLLSLVGKNGNYFPSQMIYRNESESTAGIHSTDELVFTGISDYDLDKSHILVAIANIEERHYNWGIKQIFQRRQNESNLFPEPVLLNGNIQGSLGIFSGYNGTYIVKPL